MTAPEPAPQTSGNGDIRPSVAREGGQIPTWAIIGAVVIGGVLLFSVLDHQRRAASAPAIQPQRNDQLQMVSALPPLVIPADPAPPPPPPSEIELAQPATTTSQAILAAPANTPAPYAPQPPPPNYTPPSYLPQPPQSQPPSQPAASSSSALVIDTTTSARGNTSQTDKQDGATPAVEGAIRADILQRRSTTVPQGVLIPAVLETALDSTRPGFARAVVSRDITGFDGSRVLIPRGSRLFGEYQADLAAGQKRAVVQWTRLVRPDGVTIALASPAADTEGRSGIRGRVDNHFLERFGSAILQTTLNIGATLAGRSLAGDTGVIVALPGSTQNTIAATSGSNLQPTLRVAAGTQVTVFVARDLEFPPGQARP